MVGQGLEDVDVPVFAVFLYFYYRLAIRVGFGARFLKEGQPFLHFRALFNELFSLGGCEQTLRCGTLGRAFCFRALRDGLGGGFSGAFGGGLRSLLIGAMRRGA